MKKNNHDVLKHFYNMDMLKAWKISFRTEQIKIVQPGESGRLSERAI